MDSVVMDANITIHSYPLQPSRFNDSTGATSVCVRTGRYECGNRRT
jgi:hypothetical protein